MPLLTKGNRELAADGIYTWTLPALGAKLSNGKNMLTCPNAGACASVCYARNGTYLFSSVRAAHIRNLELTLNTSVFVERIMQDLSSKRFNATGVPASYAQYLRTDDLNPWQQEWIASGGKAVRIHDSGDFYNHTYFDAWIKIAQNVPSVFFYAYTKEVAMIKPYDLPQNMTIIFSYGGKQDQMINPDTDRHADVFPSFDAMIRAGYSSNEASDILAALLPTTRIGLLVNNIPHFKKKQGNLTFSELQTGVTNNPMGF